MSLDSHRTWRVRSSHRRVAVEDVFGDGETDANVRLEVNEDWSTAEPVTLFGAWIDAFGADNVRAAFTRLAGVLSGSLASEIELIAVDVSGDLAYTVHREHSAMTVAGEDESFVLRVTQIYRREADGWKVVHRHGDTGAGTHP